MNKLSTELYNKAREQVIAEYGILDPGLLVDKITELVAKQCVYTIQMKILQDGKLWKICGRGNTLKISQKTLKLKC